MKTWSPPKTEYGQHSEKVATKFSEEKLAETGRWTMLLNITDTPKYFHNLVQWKLLVWKSENFESSVVTYKWCALHMNKCNVLSARFPACRQISRKNRALCAHITSQVRVVEVVILKTVIFTMIFKALDSSSSKTMKTITMIITISLNSWLCEREEFEVRGWHRD